MEITPLPIQKYCEKYSSKPSQHLLDMDRNTHLKTLAPQMSSGPLQGRLLSMISKMIRPQYILEIGTFTAYAAVCLTEGLTEDGQLITIEGNKELEHIARQNIEQSPHNSQIKLLMGDALEIIPKLDEEFDLIFMDAAKRQYQDYYDLIFDQWAIGGVLLADNVLWSGKVLENNHDLDTKALNQFNQYIAYDPRVENVIMPIRDGINLIRKISK